MYVMILVPCGDGRIIMNNHNLNWLLLLYQKKNEVTRRQIRWFQVIAL